MSKDDYYVIAYKILAYLYACLKQGESLDLEYLTAESFKINLDYWTYILEHLSKSVYIEGVTFVSILGKGNKGIKITPSTRITPLGIAFLHENNMMNRAKDFLKSIKDIMPNL